MIIDATEPPGDLNYDFCVIGSGPAALTFARLFLDAPGAPRVLLVESGTSLESVYLNDHDKQLSRRYHQLQSSTQDRYAGTLSGWLEQNKPDYLTESRLRAFGGTGNVWSGWLCGLEPMDLEQGDWPLDYETLARSYADVCQSFDIPRLWCLDDGAHLTHPSWRSLPLRSELFRCRPLLARRINFGQLFKSRLARARNVDLLLGANALQLSTRTDCTGTQVATSLQVHREGESFIREVRASAFVVAAGSIETTRLLQSSGFGQTSADLGYHFQEHLYIWNAARFTPLAMEDDLRRLYFSDTLVSLSPTDAVTGMLVPTANYLNTYGAGTFRAILGGASGIPGTINLCCEQLPVRENRITLNSSSGNRINSQSIHLHHQISEQDILTIQGAIDHLGQELTNAGLIKNFTAPKLLQDPTRWPSPHRLAPGNHPSGTTRMSKCPTRGVVDSNCKVHGVDNVYVSSASAFPRGGYANPTLTIMALSMRMAKHLNERI